MILEYLGKLILRRSKRGISEIFSALLVIMITVAVGLTVYLTAIDYFSTQETAIANNLMRAQKKATENLVIVRAYINKTNGELWIFVATSSGGAEIYDVFVDNTPANPIGFSLPLKLGANELVKIGPFSSPTISPGGHEVLIITDYGKVLGYAEVVG